MKLKPWVQNALLGITLIAAIVGCADYAIDENVGVNLGRQIICLVVTITGFVTLKRYGRFE